jgi:8-oxo-dGTP diphosphatase
VTSYDNPACHDTSDPLRAMARRPVETRGHLRDRDDTITELTEDSQHETIRYTADVVALSVGESSQLQVLVIQRRWNPYAGCWALPGGHVDSGETARQAGARELLEETGVAVAEADLIEVGVFDQPGRDPRGRYVSVAFVVVLEHLEQLSAGDDAAQAAWRPATLGSDELAFDHHSILTAALTVAEVAVAVPAPASSQGGGAATTEVVTLCGSMRFLPLMLDVAAEETAAGRIVLAPFAVVAPEDQDSEFKAMLDALHRRKIDKADRVLVVTDATGYYGTSTRAEIAYATERGIPVELVQRDGPASSAPPVPGPGQVERAGGLGAGEGTVVVRP